MRPWLGAGALLLLALAPLRAQPLIDFPTGNHALAEERPQDFFMYVDRDFEGEKSKPWQGGQYGFVRGPVRDNGSIVFIQMHEGVDIKPMQRDAAGNPLDPVLAAADGRVVHASAAASASNYGRYVVLEHQWDGCSYYTLYAHLAAISVQPGQTVRQGQPIAVMGFTGDGINRERAHTHFEVCLILNKNFEAWYDFHFPGNPNHHGIYNGLNLAGVDPAALLLAARRDPRLKISDFIATAEPAFKLTVKNSPDFYLVHAYPWLVPAGEIASPPAWTVTFSRHGVPLKIEASTTPVTEPVVAWVAETGSTYAHSTKGIVTGPHGLPR